MTRTKSLSLLLILLPALAAASGKPQAAALMPKLPEPIDLPLPSDAMQTTIHRLSNGLTVYLSPNHQEPRVAAWIGVRAGSKNDPADTTGLAHYLEHMNFKGTTALGTLDYAKEKPHLDRITQLYDEHFKAKDPKERERLYKEIDAENKKATEYEVPNELDKIYKRLGFQNLNAFTSNEETVYHVDMPANRAEAWARLESERFAHPVYRLFQSELEAVYEEKNQTLDNPEEILYEAVNKLLYPQHPYGTQTTIGTIEHLKNPSLSRIYRFFHEYYEPNNMAIALSGDFDRAQMLALLEKYFGAWKPEPLPAPKAWPLPEPKGREFVEVKYEAEEKVVVGWPTVPREHPDADAVTVMDMLMDNSVAGLINLDLVQAQKVKAAGSGPTFYNDAGDWGVWAVPKRGQTLEQAEALLMGEIDKLKAGAFTDDDIKAVVTNFEVAEKAKLESNEARVAEMIDSFVHYEPWPVSVGRLERLRRVTKPDVLRVANAYLGAGRVVAYRRSGKPEIPSIAKPGFTKIDIDPSRESAFAREILAMPAKPLEPHWLVPGRDYEISASPAGRIFATKNPFNDLFQLTWVIERGRRQERDLCSALRLLGLSGAGDMTADQLKKKLFAMGTSLNYGCDEWESSVSITGLDQNLWPSLELMRERFAKPVIEPDMLKRMVDVQIGAHADAKKDPENVHRALGEFAMRGKDSSVLNELSDKDLLALKEEPLRKLMAGFMDYQARIAYVGNRPEGELAKLLEEPGKRYKSQSPRPPLRFEKPAAPLVYFTHRDMVQSQVGLYGADEILDPEHAVDYSFYSAYMGGDMSSVIFQEIREARSLAYAAWGGYMRAEHKGDENAVIAGLNCQADKTVEATTLLRDLMKSPPWSERRFEETEKALEEQYRTDPIPFREIPGVLLTWEDQGIAGGDPRPKRFGKVLSYRLDDLKSFSRRFKDKVLSVYVLGPKDRAGLDGLKGLGTLKQTALDQIFPY